MNKTDEKRQLDRELADLPAGDLQPELDLKPDPEPEVELVSEIPAPIVAKAPEPESKADPRKIEHKKVAQSIIDYLNVSAGTNFDETIAVEVYLNSGGNLDETRKIIDDAVSKARSNEYLKPRHLLGLGNVKRFREFTQEVRNGRQRQEG